MKRALLFVFAFSCTPDPVHERAVSALGDERPEGPSAFHRPGQPCGTCHEAEGPAKSDFSVAGTIFDHPSSLAGVDGATVALRDADGAMREVTTNCAGNFYVLRSEWQPRFPITVIVSKGDMTKPMQSAIGVTASCAGCHSLERSSRGPISKLAPVYLFDAPEPTSGGCP